ncbi:exonuclease SbcCD subunit D [Alteribacillus sp. JSM 102045]|uniref:metallophosphoesterase family protein n=1 Tax=Alteribacillus sp. JSM 102045 TaxID=1562101 RepID=UPI0035C07484
MESIRFIHAADLHLGSPLSVAAGAPSLLKKQFENSIYAAVHKMINNAIQFKVDFIILAGDLFDQENRSIKSQLFLKQQLELLKPHGISVYIVHGNHDPLAENYAPVEWPDNVEVFSTVPEMKVFYKNNKPAAHLYGCSYREREMPTNIAKAYNKQHGAPFHIGILHGQEKTVADADNYAPFSLKDLVEKEMDYWALGHIHTRQNLSPHICYPGNIQARHRKEQGEKGYLLVDLKKDELDISFQAVSNVVFENLEISINGKETFDHLTNTLIKQIKQVSLEYAEGLWLEIELTGSGRLSEHLESEINVEEWKEAINEIGALEDPFFYIYRIKNKTIPAEVTDQIKDGEHFLGDTHQAANFYRSNPDMLQREWEELLHHPSAKKFMSENTASNMEVIIEEAERTIWNKWGRGVSN